MLRRKSKGYTEKYLCRVFCNLFRLDPDRMEIDALEVAQFALAAVERCLTNRIIHGAGSSCTQHSFMDACDLILQLSGSALKRLSPCVARLLPGFVASLNPSPSEQQPQQQQQQQSSSSSSRSSSSAHALQSASSRYCQTRMISSDRDADKYSEKRRPVPPLPLLLAAHDGDGGEEKREEELLQWLVHKERGRRQDLTDSHPDLQCILPPYPIATLLVIGKMIASQCDGALPIVKSITWRLLAESDRSLLQSGMLLLGIIALNDTSHALVEDVPHFFPMLCQGLDDEHWCFRASSCWAATHCLDVMLKRGEMDAQSLAQSLTRFSPLPKDICGVVAEYSHGGDIYFWPVVQLLLEACEHHKLELTGTAFAGVIKACASDPKLVGPYVTPILDMLSKLLRRKSSEKGINYKFSHWCHAISHLTYVMRKYPVSVSPRTSEILGTVVRTWVEKLGASDTAKFSAILVKLVPFIPSHCEHLFQLCVSKLTNRKARREDACASLLAVLGAVIRQLGSRSSSLVHSSSVGPLLLRHVKHENQEIAKCAFDAVADAAAACPPLLGRSFHKIVDGALRTLLREDAFEEDELQQLWKSALRSLACWSLSVPRDMEPYANRMVSAMFPPFISDADLDADIAVALCRILLAFPHLQLLSGRATASVVLHRCCELLSDDMDSVGNPREADEGLRGLCVALQLHGLPERDLELDNEHDLELDEEDDSTWIPGALLRALASLEAPAEETIKQLRKALTYLRDTDDCEACEVVFFCDFEEETRARLRSRLGKPPPFYTQFRDTDRSRLREVEERHLKFLADRIARQPAVSMQLQ